MRKIGKYSRSGLASIVTTAMMLTAVAIMGSGNISLNVTQIQFSTSTTSKQFQFSNQAILLKKTGSIQIPYSYSDKIPINILITTARGSIFTTQASP